MLCFIVAFFSPRIVPSRLLFELIADPAITGLMRGLEPVAHVSCYVSSASPLDLFEFYPIFITWFECWRYLDL